MGSTRSSAVGVLLAALLATGTIAAAPAQAVAQRAVPMSVLLCQFSDDTTHSGVSGPLKDEDIADFLINRGGGGVADYWNELSGGAFDFSGSVMTRWFTMPTTYANDPAIGRGRRIQDCIDAAAAGGYVVPADHRIVVFRNKCGDGGSAGGRVLLDPCAFNTSFAAHELGHALGLGHSFSNDQYQNAPWSAPGEYGDDWDLMSALHVQGATDPRWTTKPVGLNAFHLSQLGLLPADQVRTWAAGSPSTVELDPLYGYARPPGHPRELRVPVGPGHYFSVEYRYPQALDRPIGTPQVLIHEIETGRSTLLRQPLVAAPTAQGAPTQQVVVAGGTLRIAVTGTGGATATIAVTAMPTVAVPAVVGKRPAAADAAIVAVGLRSVHRSVTDDSCEHIGEVIAQTPRSGTLVAPGSTVTISVGSRPRDHRQCP